jgi:hypothetical protein
LYPQHPDFRARSSAAEIPIKTKTSVLDKDELARKLRLAKSAKISGEQSESPKDDPVDDGSYFAACGRGTFAKYAERTLVRTGSNYRKPAISDA